MWEVSTLLNLGKYLSFFLQVLVQNLFTNVEIKF